MQQVATCPNCGAQNIAGQQFCISCGAHLANVPRPMSHVPIVTGVATNTPFVTGVVSPHPSPMMTPGLPAASQQQQRIEISPSWGLAWGLFWRMFFLWLFMMGLIFLIYVVVRLLLGYTTLI